MLLCDGLVWRKNPIVETFGRALQTPEAYCFQTTSLYCVNGDPQGNTLPCQKDFGSCELKKGRSCGLGTGSSKGRTVSASYMDMIETGTEILDRILSRIKHPRPMV
jgi:hypothetical protein